MTYTSEERAILARHVTNIDGHVYGIANLPEEVIAVIFAYVSRSERSFKQNLLSLLQQGDLDTSFASTSQLDFEAANKKASEFHSRWVVAYGHSSVAEHAVAHLGVEQISRLASAELELANPFLSFTEYSQRYQKPQRGHYFVPPELDTQLEAEYRQTMDALYDAYEELYNGLLIHLEQTCPDEDGESPTARRNRLERLAFEDARYALPLSTLTSLGMTGNGRALRDACALLGASAQEETRELARQLVTETTKILPTLLRHALPSAYQKRWTQWCGAHMQKTDAAKMAPVQLLNYTGRDSENPEEAALQTLAEAMMVDLPQGFIQASLEELGLHDVPPTAFHWIRYDVLFSLSEAAWHQLLRHCRGMSFQWGPAEVDSGYTTPPNIETAGLSPILDNAINVSGKLYRTLQRQAPHTAGYAVINAHHRRVRSEFDLRQLYHLVNIRTTPEAQWDIRQVVTELWRQIKEVHPRLAAHAQRKP